MNLSVEKEKEMHGNLRRSIRYSLNTGMSFHKYKRVPINDTMKLIGGRHNEVLTLSYRAMFLTRMSSSQTNPFEMKPLSMFTKIIQLL